MAVNKVVRSDGTALIDLTTDTVTSANHIMEGYVGHLADGTSVTGTGTISASQQASLDALVRYSNEITGESDANISEAVNTLVNGFKKGDISSAYWKTVVLEEDHTEYGSSIVSTRYWKEFLGIPDEDLYNGYVYFCIVTNNNDQSGWGKWLSGFYHALGGYITCAFYRHSYDNTVCINYDDEYALFATAGTVIDIFRFKKGDSEVKRYTIEDIAEGVIRNIEEITIKSTTLETYTFSDSGFKIIHLPNAITINGRPFNGSRVELIDIPNIENLGDAFYNCSKLSGSYGEETGVLRLPKVVTANTYAFYNTRIRKVYFMTTASNLRQNIFYQCPNLTDIYVPWPEGAVNNAPWSNNANVVVHYNTVYDSNGEPIVQ